MIPLGDELTTRSRRPSPLTSAIDTDVGPFSAKVDDTMGPSPLPSPSLTLTPSSNVDQSVAAATSRWPSPLASARLRHEVDAFPYQVPGAVRPPAPPQNTLRSPLKVLAATTSANPSSLMSPMATCVGPPGGVPDMAYSTWLGNVPFPAPRSSEMVQKVNDGEVLPVTRSALPSSLTSPIAMLTG